MCIYLMQVFNTISESKVGQFMKDVGADVYIAQIYSQTTTLLSKATAFLFRYVTV